MLARCAAWWTTSCSPLSFRWWRQTASLRGATDSWAEGKTHSRPHLRFVLEYLLQRVRQTDGTVASGQVLFLRTLDAQQVFLNRRDQAIG